MAQLVRLSLFVALLLAIAAIAYVTKIDRIHVFKGLNGPEIRSAMPVIPQTSLEKYATGGEDRLAVLITDEASNWVGLAHGLKTIGIPFIMTADHKRALRHDVVLVYPMISGSQTPPATLRALARYPQNGGTLLATNVLGGGLAPVFGFQSVNESKSRTHITFQPGFPETSDFEALDQSKIKIGSENNQFNNPGTNAYLDPLNPPLAVYEDGTPAIVKRDYGDGAAYAIGVDLGQLLLKGHNFRETDISEAYVNQYQPTLDALLRFVVAVYQRGESDAVTLGTVPDGKSLSVMLTHDVDYNKSIRNAVQYAEMEASHGIRSTYFIQTKYIQDYNDAIFLNDEGSAHVRELEALGMEIASHSVSHSLQFHKFKLGSGAEKYPSYQPIVTSSKRTRSGSLMGELRVSKFILENLTDDSQVRAFRPGYLRIAKQLPEALYWSDYAYSSSVTANKSLTHLPFQLMLGRDYTNEVDIFEFPITIEDEQLPLMGERLPEAIDVADKLAKYGGTMVVLSHPDILGHKYEFATGFIEHTKPYAWFGSISDFGDWWSARNEVGIDVIKSGRQKSLILTCPEAVKGLTLNVPDGFRISSDQKKELIRTISDENWLIDCPKGGLTIRLER